MPYWGGPDFALKLARASTIRRSEALSPISRPLRRPDGAAHERPAIPRHRRARSREQAARHSRRLSRLQHRGPRIFSDPEIPAIFKRIEALKLPVFLHPNGAVGGKRFEPYYLGNILGNPFDTTIAACHLIYGGVISDRRLSAPEYRRGPPHPRARKRRLLTDDERNEYACVDDRSDLITIRKLKALSQNFGVEPRRA